METKKEDRRVMYTKMFLRESLLALMETKPVEKITTTELCRHAGINRNTFYTHYKSPEELLESIEEELLNSINSSMRGEISIESLLSIMKNNADLCRVLFSPYCPHDFWEKSTKNAMDIFISDWADRDHNLSDETKRRIIEYCLNGTIAVIKDWIKTGMETPVEKVARLINLLTEKGIYAAESYRE